VDPESKSLEAAPPIQVSRLGVVGGTFDPPHYGHLVLAENARVQLELDLVLFVPTGQPPHKPVGPITAAQHRVAMVQASIGGNPAFLLSRVDLERPAPHYTVDMLAMLTEIHPNAELFFLMGGDSLAEFASWRDPSGILERATLVVMERPGWKGDWGPLAEQIPALRGRLRVLDAPRIGLSGTDLRRRARSGLPLRYLVPPAVERYVREHSLYQPQVSSPRS
jgi:nicotinate-nucleotide adenylyltransferase